MFSNLVFIYSLIFIISKVSAKDLTDYGVTFIKDSKVLLQPSGWQEIMVSIPIFNETLPELKNSNPCTTQSHEFDVFKFCEGVRNLPKKMEELMQDKYNILESKYKEVKSLLEFPVEFRDVNRHSRAILDGIGWIGRQVFGWAQVSDLRKLQHKLTHNDNILLHSINDLRNSTVRFIQRTNSMFLEHQKNYERFVSDVKTDISFLYKYTSIGRIQLRRQNKQITWLTYFVSYLHAKIQEVQSIQEHIQYMDLWRSSILTLTKGQVPDGLVSISDMSEIRRRVEDHLARAGKKLCQRDLSYFYLDYMRYFVYTDKNLYISLKIPYIFHQQSCSWEIYHVKKWSVPISHNQQGGYTELKEVRDILLVKSDKQYYTELTIDRLKTCIAKYSYHCVETFPKISFTKSSCLWGMFTRDYGMIDKFCKFKIDLFKTIESDILSTNDGRNIILNPSGELTRTFKINGVEKTERISCVYCVLRLGCDDIIQTDTFEVSANVNCQSISFSVEQGINRPFAIAFDVNFNTFKDNISQTNSVMHAIHDKKILIQSKSLSQNYSRDLHKLAEHVANNRLSENVFPDDTGWGKTFSYDSIELTGLISLILSIISIGIITFLFIKHRRLQLIVLTLERAHKAYGFDKTLEVIVVMETIVYLILLIITLILSYKVYKLLKCKIVTSKDRFKGAKVFLKVGTENKYSILYLGEIFDILSYCNDFSIESSKIVPVVNRDSTGHFIDLGIRPIIRYMAGTKEHKLQCVRRVQLKDSKEVNLWRQILEGDYILILFLQTKTKMVILHRDTKSVEVV